MCTLIVGREVLGPGSWVLAANRDEDPARPSAPPGVLDAERGVVGGRDGVSGGTWLAVRADGVVAMLNRRPSTDEGIPPEGPFRSRGLLALDVARIASAADFAESAARTALEQIETHRFAPFTMVTVGSGRAWALAWDGAARFTEIGRGWHVVTHAELDDEAEPRTRRLLGELRDWRPESRSAAWAGLLARLAQHDEPRVCVHEGRMRTVSFSLAAFSANGMEYRHGEGRPCDTVASPVIVPHRSEHV